LFIKLNDLVASDNDIQPIISHTGSRRSAAIAVRQMARSMRAVFQTRRSLACDCGGNPRDEQIPNSPRSLQTWSAADFLDVFERPYFGPM
jgi:hypothetical protein